VTLNPQALLPAVIDAAAIAGRMVADEFSRPDGPRLIDHRGVGRRVRADRAGPAGEDAQQGPGGREMREADEAVHIGPSPTRESYLVGEKILAAAKATGKY
jgi:hypothetical protein